MMDITTQAALSDLYDDAVVIPDAMRQAGLFGEAAPIDDGLIRFHCPEIDVHEYDRIVLFMSGGKDSIYCLLKLLEMGVDKDKIELHHHNVDGAPSEETVFDWRFMHSYNTKVAEHFGLKLYFSWLDGGMVGEAHRQNAHGRPHYIETPEGLVRLDRDTKRSAPSTRMMFPMPGASLTTRWCSSSLKIEIGRRLITNQERFNHSKTLTITGERRQESPGRSKYNQFEPAVVDRRDGKLGRHVDVWRTALHVKETEVWETMERHGVLPPIPYRMGFGRSSCSACIFNSAKIWATLGEHFPEQMQTIASMEDSFGKTISRKMINVVELGKTAKPLNVTDQVAIAQSKQKEYTLPIIATAEHPWQLPMGAFSTEGCGSV